MTQRSIIERLALDHGLQVEFCSGEASALGLLSHGQSYNALIIAHELEEGDSLQVIESVRSSLAYATLPVAFVMAMEERFQEYFAALDRAGNKDRCYICCRSPAEVKRFFGFAEDGWFGTSNVYVGKIKLIGKAPTSEETLFEKVAINVSDLLLQKFGVTLKGEFTITRGGNLWSAGNGFYHCFSIRHF